MERGVAAVVLRSGMALLWRTGAGAWELPWVAPAPGEDAAEAVARLLRERLGVEAGPISELSQDGAAAGLVVRGLSAAPAPTSGLELRWVEARLLSEIELPAVCRAAARAASAHRRRDRYRGTHPREFAHKYKELSGDPEAMAKAAARGSTPAGAHRPVMLGEVLAALSPLEGATALDCTLGWGGHARALALAAGASGRVIALDRDGEELARTSARLNAEAIRVTARLSDYADAPAVLRELGVEGVDALLADFGVSSMQLDRPERGLSFKNDGPLDMRLDRSRGVTAAQWLERASEGEIAEALSRYGDEPDAKLLAARLKALSGAGRCPKTTAQLAAAVAEAKGLDVRALRRKNAFARHPAARAFQALRIVVNDEHGSLSRFLGVLPALLRPGGRAALITFHSGEERLVQAALGAQAEAGLWRGAPGEPVRPSAEEVRDNPRSRSARLWTAVRAGPGAL